MPRDTYIPHADEPAARSDGERAFCAIIEQEEPHLRRYALSLTRDQAEAEDLVQDSILRALRSRDKFEMGTHARRWLFTILKNLHIDKQRRRARRGTRVPIEDAYPTPSQPASQHDSLVLREVSERLKSVRACDRQVFMMSVVDGLSQQEIAARMDTAVGTVKSRLSRTRKVLAEGLYESR